MYHKYLSMCIICSSMYQDSMAQCIENQRLMYQNSMAQCIKVCINNKLYPKKGFISFITAQIVSIKTSSFICFILYHHFVSYKLYTFNVTVSCGALPAGRDTANVLILIHDTPLYSSQIHYKEYKCIRNCIIGMATKTFVSFRVLLCIKCLYLTVSRIQTLTCIATCINCISL